MKALDSLGWSTALEQNWTDMKLSQYVPGRVIADHGSNVRVAIPNDINAAISGRLLRFLEPHEMPEVGDWVAVQTFDEGRGLIHAILPRKSEIYRKQPGDKITKQVLAVNVDIAFLVQALDSDFSPNRLQRYLFQLNQEGVQPIIVLNKADKDTAIQSKLAKLNSLNTRVIITSATLNDGISEVAEAIPVGMTAVFLGSSGVGKSTIINALLGQKRQATQSMRETDSKGRHTTTHRELFVLSNGGLVIDTPGLRELQLWGTEDELAGVFTDIDSLTRECKFNDCTHTSEPGCSVLKAVELGVLDATRLDSYRKLRKELQYLDTKLDENAAYAKKQTDRKMGKYYKQVIEGKRQIKNI